MSTKNTNPDKTPVAQDVFTWCTKEKTETWHVVRNHGSDGIVDRVVCKACGSEHKYRRAQAFSAKPASSGRVIIRGTTGGVTKAQAALAAHSEALETSWFSGIKKWGEKPVKSFDPTNYFGVGEVLEHTAFGKGVVQGRRENKIDVLFKSGLKTLPSTSQKPAP